MLNLKFLEKIEYLKTGDYGYFDKDKFFYVKGRSDRIIKLNGIRLDLNNLEIYLKKQLLLDLKLAFKKDSLKVFIVKEKQNFLEIKRKIAKLANIHSTNIKLFYVKNFPLTRSRKTDYHKLSKLYD